MSKNGKDGLMSCLFSQDMVLDNVKFFRGEAKVISEASFRDALCAAEARKRDGSILPSANPPTTGEQAIDVREWVANM